MDCTPTLKTNAKKLQQQEKLLMLYRVNGITIHSFLRLPVTNMLQEDLSGQALVTIQVRLKALDYIIMMNIICLVKHL